MTPFCPRQFASAFDSGMAERSKRERLAEAAAELDVVDGIDRPVVIEVERRVVCGITGDLAEGVAELLVVQGIDRSVSVVVAEKTMELEPLALPKRHGARDGRHLCRV